MIGPDPAGDPAMLALARRLARRLGARAKLNFPDEAPTGPAPLPEPEAVPEAPTTPVEAPTPRAPEARSPGPRDGATGTPGAFPPQPPSSAPRQDPEVAAIAAPAAALGGPDGPAVARVLGWAGSRFGGEARP